MNKQWRHIMVVAGLAVVMLAAAGCTQQVRPRKAAAPAKGIQSIHFDYDRSAVKQEYVPVMKSNSEWLKQHSAKKIVVEGNCDERGSVEYNIALGWRRARSAKNYLVSLGVSPSRVSTKSYGKERPVCTEHNESCWWRNRRADFVPTN